MGCGDKLEHICSTARGRGGLQASALGDGEDFLGQTVVGKRDERSISINSLGVDFRSLISPPSLLALSVTHQHPSPLAGTCYSYRRGDMETPMVFVLHTTWFHHQAHSGRSRHANVCVHAYVHVGLMEPRFGLTSV